MPCEIGFDASVDGHFINGAGMVDAADSAGRR